MKILGSFHSSEVEEITPTFTIKIKKPEKFNHFVIK